MTMRWNVGHFDKTSTSILRHRVVWAKPEVDKIRTTAMAEVDQHLYWWGEVRESICSFLLDQGIENVYQLHGSIQTYEKCIRADVKGALFTGDDRKVIHFGGEQR